MIAPKQVQELWGSSGHVVSSFLAEMTAVVWWSVGQLGAFASSVLSAPRCLLAFLGGGSGAGDGHNLGVVAEYTTLFYLASQL